MFHVSQLKRKLGSSTTVVLILPPVNHQGIIRPEQEEILARRMAKAKNWVKFELLVR